MSASSAISFFFFSSRRRHTRFDCDWSSDVCSSDLTTSCRRQSSPSSRHALPPVQAFVPRRRCTQSLHVASGALKRLRDRKSTRLNSSHSQISYAVFCLKKKKNLTHPHITAHTPLAT